MNIYLHSVFLQSLAHELTSLEKVMGLNLLNKYVLNEGIAILTSLERGLWTAFVVTEIYCDGEAE